MLVTFSASVGILCDILMMVLFKRPLIILLGETVLPKAPWFWGLPKETAARPTTGKKGGAVNA